MVVIRQCIKHGISHARRYEHENLKIRADDRFEDDSVAHRSAELKMWPERRHFLRGVKVFGDSRGVS